MGLSRGTAVLRHIRVRHLHDAGTYAAPARLYRFAVYFRASAWSWVRQFTSDCMGAVIAEVVNGRVIAIANVRGIFDRRVVACGGHVAP